MFIFLARIIIISSIITVHDIEDEQTRKRLAISKKGIRDLEKETEKC